MNLTSIEEKTLWGISARTKNENEANPATAKIGNLYKRFDESIPVDYKAGARVYGAYYNYESDANGEYSVLAATDRKPDDNKLSNSKETIEEITIPAGQYLVFEAKGEVPAVVIETWTEIWNYFASEGAEYQRAYVADFEFYKSETEVDIYIGIKPI